MGLEKMIEDILQKGQEQSDEIVRQGERERDESVRLAEERIAENRRNAEKRAASSVTQMEQQEVSSAELESKKILLAAQRQSLEELKALVLSELSHYPPEKRSRLYEKLVARASKELGECYVLSTEADKSLLRLAPGMAHGGSIAGRGGLVFESKDRSVRLDFRFESMLDEVWAKDIQEIYTKLFG
jgi:V/A-type H+-transporting ATPase subunit E